MFSIALGSTTASRRRLVVRGIDERSRRDIESCAGDASLCTGMLCSSSRLRYGLFFSSFAFFISRLIVCTVLSTRPFD